MIIMVATVRMLIKPQNYYFFFFFVAFQELKGCYNVPNKELNSRKCVFKSDFHILFENYVLNNRYTAAILIKFTNLIEQE